MVHPSIERISYRRFKNYKIGWIKNGEQEYAYKDDNFLWSTVWDESFIDDEQFKTFSKRVQKYNCKNVKEAIFNEVPSIISVSFIEKFFTIKYNMLTLWEDLPQLYILLSGIKNDEYWFYNTVALHKNFNIFVYTFFWKI